MYSYNTSGWYIQTDGSTNPQGSLKSGGKQAGTTHRTLVKFCQILQTKHLKITLDDLLNQDFNDILLKQWWSLIKSVHFSTFNIRGSELVGCRS